jgi:aflatoxin B1 aldehyde reductase
MHFDNDGDVKAFLDAAYARGLKQLDTGRNYDGSEERLGRADAASRFIIHTKVFNRGPGSHEPSKLEQSITESLADLKVSCVETMFLHVPDRQTPLEVVAKAMNEAFEQGKFNKFGISNHSAAEVQQLVDICEREGYVKPSVFQGHYNAIVRGGEQELFPLLRKHNISFMAYSPAAGGLFTGNTASAARWSQDNVIGKLYSSQYGKAPVRDSVATVRTAAEKHGISGHAAALRWTAYHSILDGKFGDSLIFAASKMEQLQNTMDALDAGPLPAEVADAITKVYETVKGAEPSYHL